MHEQGPQYHSSYAVTYGNLPQVSLSSSLKSFKPTH